MSYVVLNTYNITQHSTIMKNARTTITALLCDIHRIHEAKGSQKVNGDASDHSINFFANYGQWKVDKTDVGRPGNDPFSTDLAWLIIRLIRTFQYFNGEK